MGDMIRRKLQRYRQPLALMLRYCSGQKVLLVTFVVLSVLGVLTESLGVFLLVPLLETMGRDNIFSSVPLLGHISRFFDSLPADTRLLWAGTLMLVVVLLRGTLQMAQEFIGYAIPHRIDLQLRLRAYDALVNTSMLYVDSIGAGKISSITVYQPARVGIALRFGATLIANIFVLVSYVVVLGVVAPILCFAAGIYVTFSTLLFKRMTTGIVHRVGRELTEANQKFSQIFYEILNGAKLIRLAGATRDVQRDLEGTVRMLSRARDHTVAVENMTVPFFSVVGGILICVLVMIVGLMNSELAAQAVGTLVIFVVLVLRILAPLSIINISRNNIIIHLDAFEELDAFFSAAERARERDGAVHIDGFHDRIRLEGVDFRYVTDQPKVVSAICADIIKGQMTAVVGPSGSGKSTLINLITRLYRPSAGRILVDGRPLEDLAIASWWRLLGVVSQDVVIVNDSIRANLCFGLKEPVSIERLRAAARLAAIDDWIESLPEGYDTVLGDRGSRLSGGQRQRLALARAFLRDPDIIILDEATSALDTLTEQIIQQQILSLSRKKTIVVIAHRLSTVRRADKIIVLDQGRIAEMGHHDDLLAKQGLYWRMIRSQSLDLLDDEPPEKAAQAG